MTEVTVADLQSQLQIFLGRVRDGEELVITSNGEAVAKLKPFSDERQEARQQLRSLREKCFIGDILSPVGIAWEADDASS